MTFSGTLSIALVLLCGGCGNSQNRGSVPFDAAVQSDAQGSPGSDLAMLLTDGGGGHYMGGVTPQNVPEVGMEGGSTIPAAFSDAHVGLFVSEGLQMGTGVYRIVWKGITGGTVMHRHFTGSVWTTSAVVTFAPGCRAMDCALEPGDFVGTPVDVPGGQRIDFDTDASDGFDGFEFTTSQSIIYVDVIVDGKRDGMYIFYPSIGGMGAPVLSPTVDPIKILTS